MASLIDDEMNIERQVAPLNVNDYSIDFNDPVGKGATATIYHARRKRDEDQSDDYDGSSDKEPNELVFKVLTSFLEAEAIEKQNTMLQTEVAVMMDLQRHPNLVAFYGVCELERDEIGGPHKAIQMEYCNGGDLVTAISKHRFSEPRAHAAISGTLRGLAHMHENGYVHRDVKPENILLTASGIVKLVDFGISSRLDDEQGMARRCGSPGYVAPEVWLGETYDIKVDTFSAGCVLYFIISGRMAFGGSCLQSVMQKTLKAPVNFRRSMCLERLSDDCKDFMKKLLEKSADNRPTASEAVQAMWTLPPELEMEYSSPKKLGVCKEDLEGDDGRRTMDESQASTRYPTIGDSDSRRSTKSQSGSRESRRSVSSSQSDPTEYVEGKFGVGVEPWEELGVLSEYQPSQPKNPKPWVSPGAALRRLRYKVETKERRPSDAGLKERRPSDAGAKDAEAEGEEGAKEDMFAVLRRTFSPRLSSRRPSDAGAKDAEAKEATFSPR